MNEANQHITINSEGSCDTEDWSNDADSSALHHRIKKNAIHIYIYIYIYDTIESSYFNA